MHADEFLRLACLDYDEWNLARDEEARAMLAEHPELAREDIYAASAAGDAGTVRAMLAGDPALVNRKGGPHGWEPLLYACYSRVGDTLDAARVLLESGADPNAQFLWKGNLPPFTALTGAFGQGEAGTHHPPHARSLELARLLLDAGADPNDGQTIYNRHFRPEDEHLKLLLAYGLDDPQMLAEELWSAARKNFPDRVKLLVEHGVDVNTPGRRDGRTPYEAAVRAGHDDIAGYLLAHGAKKSELSQEERLTAALIAGRREEVASFADMVDSLDHHRRVELLHRAVESNRAEGLRLMAELGFPISGMTKHDGVASNLAATPLHNAAWGGNLPLVKLLLDLGADPTIRDPNYDGTPLDWAAYNRQQEVVDYLTARTPADRRD